MKRIFLTLLCGLLLIAPLAAQSAGLTQRGKATQQLQDDGLSIGHPSLPISSKVQTMTTYCIRFRYFLSDNCS